MSPDHILGKVTEKSDIWSIGIIIYMMICNQYPGGKPPFHSRSIEGTVNKILSGNPRFDGNIWTNVSRDLVDLIENMLETDKSRRPSAEQALCSRFFRKNIQENPFFKSKDFFFQMSLNKFSVFFKQSTQTVRTILIEKLINSSQALIKYAKIFEVFHDNEIGVIWKKDLQEFMRNNEIDESVHSVIGRKGLRSEIFINYADLREAANDWDFLITEAEVAAAFPVFNEKQQVEVRQLLIFVTKNKSYIGDEFLQEINKSRTDLITVQDLRTYILRGSLT